MAKINPKTGFVSRPTAGQSRPVRPSQPIGKGVVATSNAGKVSKKQVKG